MKMKTPEDLVVAVGGATIPLCDSHDLRAVKDIRIGSTPPRAWVDGYQCRKCWALLVSKKAADAAIVRIPLSEAEAHRAELAAAKARIADLEGAVAAAGEHLAAMKADRDGLAEEKAAATERADLAERAVKSVAARLNNAYAVIDDARAAIDAVTPTEAGIPLGQSVVYIDHDPGAPIDLVATVKKLVVKVLDLTAKLDEAHFRTAEASIERDMALAGVTVDEPGAALAAGAAKDAAKAFFAQVYMRARR